VDLKEGMRPVVEVVVEEVPVQTTDVLSTTEEEGDTVKLLTTYVTLLYSFIS